MDDGRTDDLSDEDLVALAGDGDQAAFTTLVHRHADRVYAICWRYFRDDADAQDATQEVFLAVHRNAGRFRGGARFSTWLYRIAVNACNDIVRRREVRPRSAGVDPERLTATGPDDIANLELDLDLRTALAKLGAEHREAVVLHSLYGVPYADIAEQAGVSVGTVKSRVHRGLAQLARLLALQSMQPFGSDAHPSHRPDRPGTQP